MKKIIIFSLSILAVIPAMAIAECEVHFEWSPKTEFGVGGYMLFCREEGKAYNYDDPIWEGDASFTQCTIGGLDESKTYYFVIRAVDIEDNQSHDSNEIEYNYAADDAGMGGSGSGSGSGSSTNFSSCFIQSLSNPN
jgi:hypothetical protein